MKNSKLAQLRTRRVDLEDCGRRTTHTGPLQPHGPTSFKRGGSPSSHVSGSIHSPEHHPWRRCAGTNVRTLAGVELVVAKSKLSCCGSWWRGASFDSSIIISTTCVPGPPCFMPLLRRRIVQSRLRLLTELRDFSLRNLPARWLGREGRSWGKVRV